MPKSSSSVRASCFLPSFFPVWRQASPPNVGAFDASCSKNKFPGTLTSRLSPPSSSPTNQPNQQSDVRPGSLSYCRPLVRSPRPGRSSFSPQLLERRAARAFCLYGLLPYVAACIGFSMGVIDSSHIPHFAVC